MTRRLVLLGSLLMLVVPAAAEAKRTVPRGWIGMNAGLELTSRPNLLGSEFGRMPRAGVESVRLTVNWDEVEPTRGTLNFTATDRVVGAAARRRLRMLITVLSAPRWASDDVPNVDAPILTPRNPADYAAFMTALVRRYGPHGSFWSSHRSLPRMAVRGWQIWNEPDLSFFWNKPRAHRHQGDRCDNQPWARSYAKLLKASYRAIHRRDKKAKVVLAGMPNYPWEYVCALYRAGAGKSFDEAAMHPYAYYVGPKQPTRKNGHTVWGRGGVLEMVRLVREVMDRHHDRRKPLLLTEVAWPAAKGKVPYDTGISVTPSIQVKRIKQALPTIAKYRRKWGIAGIYWYSWLTDFDPAFDQPFRFAGLRRVFPDGHVTSEPGLAAFTRTARRLEGRR